VPCDTYSDERGFQAAIEKNNHKGLKLHAVIETAPQEQLLQIVQKLDDLRSSGVSPIIYLLVAPAQFIEPRSHRPCYPLSMESPC
jgi:hypothetical protein